MNTVNEEAINLPLMENNINRRDLDVVIEFLQGEPKLTQGNQVTQFEQSWSEWIGKKHSVFVNSGSSANLLTMTALKILHGYGDIILPTLTWVSDCASVIQAGLNPIFVDIDPNHLGMSTQKIIDSITPNTKAVFITHILGLNALTQQLLDYLEQHNILLIEDVCESYGATFNNKKLGSYGYTSNFSFYYAHHLSTIEGGMISTDDKVLYETLRMLRSHGMVRECTDQSIKNDYAQRYPDLNPDFIFSHASYNLRSTEINAVIGLHQLKRIDEQNTVRNRNFLHFLAKLDSNRYKTNFDVTGCCSYALILILKHADEHLRDAVQTALTKERVEFRRGCSGGGNQLRQPYLRSMQLNPEDYPNVEHVHFFGFYIGNYPSLSLNKIDRLCELLNSLEYTIT